AYHACKGALVLGVAAHGLADRIRTTATCRQVDIPDEAVQPSRKQADAFFGGQEWFARRFRCKAAVKEGNIPQVCCQKSGGALSQISLAIPGRWVGYRHIQIECPRPPVRT